MQDPLGAGPRGALTAGSRRGALIGVLVSAPILTLAIAAMIGRGLNAARDGDTVTASSFLFSGIIVGALVVAVGIGLVIYLRRRLRLMSHRFGMLKEAYPDSLAFVVGYSTLTVDAPLPEWAQIRVSEIHAVVFSGPDLILVRVSSSAEVIARVRDANCLVSVGTREISRTEVVQVEIIAHADGMTVTVGVLPVDVVRFSQPAFESLNELVAGIRSEVAGAARDSSR